ncbi:MAG: serine/threonine protein kinase [Planctomycetes bacterium]|nr:serine/threonine protein kinase [Planctomycetota bacterium]
MFGLWRKKDLTDEIFPGLTAFDKLGTISEGKKSILYRVRGPDRKSEFCLKILKPAAAQVADKLRRIGMKWEGDWNLGFDHPNIVQTFYAGKENETYFLLLEYLSGQSLLHVIHQEPQKIAGRRHELACSMAETLSYLHQQNVIHRDICPKNFMFNDRKMLKLIDFGVCISSSDRVLTRGNWTGTPSYMAPEIVTNKQYNEQTDVYAFGVTLYELFTGVKPFKGDDAQSVMMQHLRAQAPAPRELKPEIPPELEALVLRAMDRRANSRYQRMEDVFNALKGLSGVTL